MAIPKVDDQREPSSLVRLHVDDYPRSQQSDFDHNGDSH